jgi:hypothetical protein
MPDPNLWTGTLSDAWALAGNWSLLHIPAAGEDVVFDEANLAGLKVSCAVGPTVDVTIGSLTIAPAFTQAPFHSPSISHLTVSGTADLSSCVILGTPTFNGPTRLGDACTIGNGAGGGTFNGPLEQVVADINAIAGGTFNVPVRFSSGSSFDAAVFNCPVVFDGIVDDNGIACTFNSDVTLASADAGIKTSVAGTLHHYAGGVTGGTFTHIISRAAALGLSDGDNALDLSGCCIEIDGHLTVTHQGGQAGVTSSALTEIYLTRPHAKATFAGHTYLGRIIKRTGALRGRGHSRRGR